MQNYFFSLFNIPTSLRIDELKSVPLYYYSETFRVVGNISMWDKIKCTDSCWISKNTYSDTHAWV